MCSKVMFYNIIIFRYLITCRPNMTTYKDRTTKKREQ